MARVSVFYDKDIKEQVFMVRGDERYTHATKTIIELGDTGSQDVYGYVQEIHVNVLRDYGDSSIIIYDNDVALTVIDDWTSTDTGRAIELPPITWDTPHKIQAKYIGNGKCSPSMSNVLEIPARPNEYKSDETLVADYEYVSGTSQTSFRVGAWFDGHPSAEVGQPINFYLDGEYVDTVNIDSTEYQAGIQFSNVSTGLHTVKAEFEGSVELYAKSVTLNISVGTKLTFLSKPAILVTGDTSSFRVKATNYLDEAISGATIVAKYHNSEETVIPFDVEIADSNGIATLSNTIPSDIGDGTIYFYDSNSNLLSSVNLPQFTPTTLTMTPTTDQLYKNQDTIFSVNVGQKFEGIPVTFKEIDIENTVITTNVANTDVNGVATFTVRGKGEQNRIFKAELGAVNLTDWFEDYSQYWEANNIVNRGYSLPSGGQLLDLASGFQIYPTASGQDVWLYLAPPKNKEYAIYLDNVYSTNSQGVVQDIHFHVYNTSNNYKLKANHSNIWIYRGNDGSVRIFDSWGNSYNIANQGNNPAILIFHQKTTFSKLTIRESTHDTLVVEE